MEIGSALSRLIMEVQEDIKHNKDVWNRVFVRQGAQSNITFKHHTSVCHDQKHSSTIRRSTETLSWLNSSDHVLYTELMLEYLLLLPVSQ